MTKKPRIKIAHIGRPIDFIWEKLDGTDVTLNGTIHRVARGIATIHYYVPGKPSTEPFVTYMRVQDRHIVEIY